MSTDNSLSILEKSLSPFVEEDSPNIKIPETTNRNTETTESSPFPMEVFEGTIIEELAVESERVFKVPKSMAAMTALAVLSAACGKHYTITGAHAKDSYPNVYVMIAAKSGTGKSLAFDLLAKPIVEASSEKEKKYEDTRNEDLTRADVLGDQYKGMRKDLVTLAKQS
ncbi:MAG: DUF3987 domain-containing protein [Opitutales bacterium]|jgi:hypothetical protein|nr:DUF3987 domain-containing protein [Opitutales bacterium]